MNRLHVLLALMALVPPVASSNHCAVSGEAIHWAEDYCMYLAATDDFFNPKVTECFVNQGKISRQSECSARIQYKRKICEITIRNQSYDGTVEACIRDEKFSGPSVRRRGA
jgi:hypothetical protein